jgi:hypothetical protein
MTEGPTVDLGKLQAQQSMMANIARNLALSKKADSLLAMHNIPANNIAVNQFGGGLGGMGAMSIGPGTMFQWPGGEPVVAPSYGNVPPGNIRVQNQGGQTVATSPYPPSVAGAQLGYNNLANLISGAAKITAETGEPLPSWYGDATNLLQRGISEKLGKASSEVRSFANESAARAGGAKAGDIVFLQGVGKVRLK